MQTVRERMEALKKVKSGGGSYNWFEPGEYLVRVSSVKTDDSSRIKGKEFTAVSAIVVKTDSTSPNMAVGKTVDWSTGSDKDSYAGNVKQVLTAILGLTDEEYDEMSGDELELIANGILGKAQVAVGRLLRVFVKMVKTRAGKDFTAVRWGAVPEEEQDQMTFEQMMSKLVP